ncbi:putative SEC27-coatomer complex beta subunit [Meira miltonrushii]|uniref:Coatomer subunit beta' n=1 Tax=Meira miltonrushii TaxID=1280837 RepID=A0A316VE99_9BASI|nr:putative SEC27-coatomer complex beta subunit [Meira miltonrushii]PWN35624.1 putative SEC27-coatomer complex beta subunit [Meira miltonrushii]
MPMLLDITRKLFARSDRVKAVDFHPTEPWLLAGLYTGSVNIWNYETGALIKTFEVAEVPVRCVKFIARKNWFVAGSDDFQLRCFNYNTHEKVIAFEAHPDYIRCIAVHPTGSYILTGSDDMTIKMWDWDKNWRHLQTFEGHTHFVMNLAFNPKDSNSFASACLDRTVKIWTPGSATANFTLEAHDKGVNYVEYYHGGEKPYLVTTGDDRTVKIWDYISKSCIQTLDGHLSNVSFACFHPSLPLIISGSEDGTVKLWHSNTYRLETTLDYGLERAWCVAYRKTGNDIAIGYDDGVVVVKLGKEEPSVSMDTSGKVVWAKGAEVLSANLGASETDALVDGQRIAAGSREMGSTEVHAQSLQHSPNGRFVTVCGDGEYIIYTALAWRNKAFGTGFAFAWASDSNTYAVKESNSLVKVFRNFRERANLINISYAVEDVKGGALLGVTGSGFACFYDWDTGALVRRIEVEAKDVSWSSTGELVAITSGESFYILRFDRQAYQNGLDSGEYVEDEGVESAFDVVTEISEVVKTAKWTGECFIYTNAQNRIQYLVGEQTHTVNHTDTELYLLGYLPSHGRVYLVDKDVSIYSFALSLAVVEYQTAILRQDYEGASEILKTVPADQRNRIARFLESQDLKKLALEVSTDPDHKFDLAVSLDDFDTALEIAQNGPEAGSELRWRTIGDKALLQWNLRLALECFEKASDLQTLFLIASSTGDRDLLQRIAEMASEKKIVNLAMNCYLQLGDTGRSVDVLVQSGRLPEAALFARSYAPSRVPEIVELWRASLKESKRSKQDAIATSLGDPTSNPEAFEEGWKEALKRESEFAAKGPTALAKSNEAPKVVAPTLTNGASGLNGNTTNAVEDASAQDQMTESTIVTEATSNGV